MSSIRRQCSPVIEPKSSFYKGDGTGRDGYILTNSGGFYRPFLPTMASPSGSYGKHIGSKNNRPRLDAKTLSYHSDGTGRDNYIIANAGGLTRHSGDNKQCFYNTLRQYDKGLSPTYNGSIDYFTWAQYQKPRTDQKVENLKDKTVKNLVSRLTLPKANSPTASPKKAYATSVEPRNLRVNSEMEPEMYSNQYSRSRPGVTFV